MALILNSSLVADLSGKVGNLVYSRNRGGPYVRNKGVTVQPFTPKQVIAFFFMDDASSAWQLLSDFEFSEWATFTKNFKKTNNLGIQKDYTPRGFFVRCYVFRKFAGLTGNPQPVMPEDLGFKSLKVSRTTLADYLFTIAGGAPNSDFSVLYKTNGPYTIGTRSINTTQQVFFHTADYSPGTVDLRAEFDIGFPGQWPTVPPKRLWASCQVILKASGVCVGESNSQMLWPFTPTQAFVGTKEVFPSSSFFGGRLAKIFTADFDGVVTDIATYHSGGSSNVLVGVYNVVAGIITSRIALSVVTPFDLSEGWQNVDLITPAPLIQGNDYAFAFCMQSDNNHFDPLLPNEFVFSTNTAFQMPIVFGVQASTGFLRTGFANLIYDV